MRASMMRFWAHSSNDLNVLIPVVKGYASNQSRRRVAPHSRRRQQQIYQVVTATLTARGGGCGMQSGQRISELDRQVGLDMVLPNSWLNYVSSWWYPKV